MMIYFIYVDQNLISTVCICTVCIITKDDTNDIIWYIWVPAILISILLVLVDMTFYFLRRIEILCQQEKK